MRHVVFHDVEKYTNAHLNKKRWYRVVTCLACMVVFCTVYALILPAITMEKYDCDIPEHTHTIDCYTQVTAQEKSVPVCDAETLKIHQHSPECCDGDGNLICGYADFVVHEHDAACYDEDGILWCPLPEIEAHVHTDGCYAQPESTDEQELAPDPELICRKPEISLHQHTPDCFDAEQNLICGQTQVLSHQHTDACFETLEEPVDTEALTCTLSEDENHTHSALCYGSWELTCGMEEHVHSESCMAEHTAKTDQERVEELIALIDALPTSAEIEEALTALDEAGDEDGYEAYFADVSLQAQTAYVYYEDLSPELQELVTNRDKLLELQWMWSATTMAIQDTLKVFQINSYSPPNNVTILVQGGTVSEKLGGGMSYTYWDVIVVEKNNSGKLYVASYETANVNKGSYSASTSDGFVLLLYNTSVNASVGDEVSVSFDYKTTGAYNSAGYGTVTFSTPSTDKPAKDNTGKLKIVPSADTSDLIEVNLYDYGDNINDLYNSNSNYPGFQQEYGSTNVGNTLSTGTFNFGNNITADLAAGKYGVTVAGGSGINATTNGANSPISGALSPTLGSDGYPALADGKSLSYLFTDNTYAAKKNSGSINGLFQYDAVSGSYHYNSRENHAQFDPVSNSFKLYNQIMTPNFMMYPFGNFLPFNDIVHDSAQVSTIDRAYLGQIADSAGNKSGLGAAYGTLSAQLNKFLTLMDTAQDNTNWMGVDCLNQYFSMSGLPKTFSNDDPYIKNMYSLDYDVPTDFYFGMEMKMNFVQPKGGLTGNDGNQPMVFSFSGDDDVWVYIDGVLFLDLSGIHRHVGGEIDFVNGKVRYFSLDVSTGDISTTAYKEVSFSDLVSTGLNEKGTFTDYSSHSFNFYYMERGSGSGVCRMNFNFPLLQKNTISVTKKLSVDEQDLISILGNPDFRFQILKENSTDPFIPEGTTFEIRNMDGTTIGTSTTGPNGVFTLKANQTAIFSGISENSGKYYVRELLRPEDFEQYGTIQVNGVSQTVDHDVTVGTESFKGLNSPIQDVSDGSTSFYFNNQITFKKLGSLSIEKTLTEFNKSVTSPQFDFEVSLDGTLLPVGTTYTVGDETRTVTEAGLISLYPGEKATVPNILSGTQFTVKELEQSSEGYVVRYSVDGSEPVQSETGVAGTVRTLTESSVIINNAEQGTTVTIPVQKTLNLPDGLTHSYTMHLEQVTSQTDMTPAEPLLAQDLQMDISLSPVTQAFEIGYAKVTHSDLPKTYYYRITETADAEHEPDTAFDSTVYVAEVTVSEENGVLSASVSNLWKDGILLTDTEGQPPTITFANTIVRYELPSTGGAGTTPYTVGGVLLITAAAILLLYSHHRRRKEDSVSS